MEMRDVTRIFLAGDEVEVRQLNAAEVLQARQKSRQLQTQYAGDDTDGLLLDAACIAAESIYRGGAHLFASPEAVLETLTADTLIWTVAELTDTTFLRKTGDGRPTAAARTDAPDDAMQAAEPRNGAVFGSESGRSAIGREWMDGAPAAADAGRIEADAEIIRNQHFRDEMQMMSDFFERDHRRYDDGFVRY